MRTQRQRRVEELLKEEISRIMQFKMRDPRLGLVTVTDVEVSSDLKHARVFVSIYGGQVQINRSMECLTASAGFVRTTLGHSIKLRYTPEITFVYDESVARAARITQLLNQIAQESQAAPEASREEAQEPHGDNSNS